MKIGRIICFCILLTSLLALFPLSPVLAQEEEPPPEESIELITSYTKLEGGSGDSFQFEVELEYHGSEARIFDLSATAPSDWAVFITPSYPQDKVIKDIRLEPDADSPERISVIAGPVVSLPEPGEYQITVEATSGEIQGSIQLTAVVTAKYEMSVSATEERYNTSATAGEKTYFSMTVENTGSAAIDTIVFSSSKPREWTVEFDPPQIDSLAAGSSQVIEVTIKPSSKTIPGDYRVYLETDATQARGEIEVRVTVETPTIWGWVGVIIILLVVAGLAYIFIRFRRR